MVALFCLMGASPQIYNDFKDPSIYHEFTNLYKVMQPKQFRIVTSTPNASNIEEGEIVIVSTGTLNLFTKVKGIVNPLTRN